MNTRMLLGTLAALSVSYAPSAFAQSLANVPPPHATSSLPAGVTVVPPPPEGYDATTASAQSNAAYAIPPAPNRVASPKLYEAWHRAVVERSTRETPTFTQTDIFNGPPKNVVATAKSQSVASATSSNWSGSTVINFTNPKNEEAIIQVFTVPTAHQAFGACTGGWDYSSVWPGIDGWNSTDVLQGGIEADAYCSGSTKTTYYSAWTEWYPNGETRVSSPVISPGDLLFVEVWNDSATSGYVYFKDYSTNVTAQYHLTAPSGTTLKGNSAEWIVERPGIGSGLATLTNYIDVTSTGGIAWDYTNSPVTYYYPNLTPTVGELLNITMNDSSGKGISSATGWTSETLWFLDFGSACGLANTAGNAC